MEHESPVSFTIVMTRLAVLTLSAIRDTDEDIGFFYKSCAEAGPDECAIYEKTADAVKARVEKLFDTLKHQPIPVATGTGPPYGLRLPLPTVLYRRQEHFHSPCSARKRGRITVLVHTR
jgi:hypothetical protein